MNLQRPLLLLLLGVSAALVGCYAPKPVGEVDPSSTETDADSATDSDTEEDEEAVPGTPPDDYPNKRPCTDGAHGGSFDGSGW